jgi:prophage regulatory protein
MHENDPSKLLRLKEVSQLTSLGKSTINLWVTQDKFPKPIALSTTIKVWRRKDLTDWIDKQIEARSDARNPESSVAELRLVHG